MDLLILVKASYCRGVFRSFILKLSIAHGGLKQTEPGSIPGSVFNIPVCDSYFTSFPAFRLPYPGVALRGGLLFLPR